MAQIFNNKKRPFNSPKRNVFDLSKAWHGSLRFGELVPVYFKEVLPGDSFKIDPVFGLKFEPMAFPIQSKLHASLHFFYSRNRNVYDDWQDYIDGTKDGLVLPYRVITPVAAPSQIGTSTLGDYAGVPTTIAGRYANFLSIPCTPVIFPQDWPMDNVRSTNPVRSISVADLPQTTNYRPPVYWLVGISYSNLADVCQSTFAAGHTLFYALQPYSTGSLYTPECWAVPYPHAITTHIKGDITFAQSHGNASTTTFTAKLVLSVKDDYFHSLPARCLNLSIKQNKILNPDAICSVVNDLVDAYGKVYFTFVFDNSSSALQSTPAFDDEKNYRYLGASMLLTAEANIIRDATDPTAVAFNPFVTQVGDTLPKIKISAFPFRHYEAIYNSFYRPEVQIPFKPDGVHPEYNRYVRRTAGGADNLTYNLYRRAWEADYFTSAQSSPQFGPAPLVGVTASGTFTFKDMDSGTTYTAQATIGDDGETITGISTHSPDMPQGSLRQLMDTITNGISINDFRNVNSLQRWLENNVRRGLHYADVIKSHFGVEPSFKLNDIPEFIGGIHEVVDVNTITNTSENLGQQAGVGSCVGGSKHSITKFCDEHGYIIGVLCVYPEPIYSQMLPKHLIKTESKLDFYFPEFSRIGMQPITYNEVCPIQTRADDISKSTQETPVDTLNDTFGYQMAHADYKSDFDEVHGTFRTYDSDCVISRTFDEKPELGEDFVNIDENSVNDVFMVQDDTPKIKGQIRFNVIAKRPLPTYAVEALE